MATINPTQQWIAKGVSKTTWSGCVGGDTIVAASEPTLPDKTVYITGTLNSVGVTIQGSNNTATGPFFTLVDPQGNALTFTASGNEVVLENPQFIKFTTTGTATESMSYSVILLSRG